MKDLRGAVRKTIAYSSYFKFPLTDAEIHHWLIYPQKISTSRLKQYLPKPLTGKELRFRSASSGYVAKKILQAKKAASVMKHIPGLRFVAITGSIAAGNSYVDDDIDLLFVTAPHVLWIVRPVVVLILSVFFSRRYPGEKRSKNPNAFCPNLWLDTLALTILPAKQSLYSAHELLQTIPLIDKKNTYSSLLRSNRWTGRYLANAYSSLTRSDNLKKASTIYHPRSEIYYLILSPLNYLLYLLQLLYMSPKRTTENVSLHSAYLHTIDFSHKINSHLDNHKDI